MMLYRYISCTYIIYVHLDNCFVTNVHIYIIGAKPCPFPGDLRCNSSQACVRYDQWCNNQIDCDDGSDEDNCCKHNVFHIKAPLV